MGKVSFNGVRVDVKRHELWFERNMYIHAPVNGTCIIFQLSQGSNEKNYQCILSLWSQPHHQLQQWWLVGTLYNICLAFTKKKKKFFSQKMWWKRKCVKIRFVWKRWCIKAFDFLKTCCGIYILYDWTPARLKRMCDLLFSALLIVSQAFTGVSCPTIIAFVSTHGSSFTYILGSQMLRGSRGKGTDGETIINTETLK